MTTFQIALSPQTRTRSASRSAIDSDGLTDAERQAQADNYWSNAGRANFTRGERQAIEAWRRSKRATTSLG